MSEVTEKWLKRMEYYRETDRPGSRISLVSFISDICGDVERLERELLELKGES